MQLPGSRVNFLTILLLATGWPPSTDAVIAALAAPPVVISSERDLQLALTSGARSITISRVIALTETLNLPAHMRLRGEGDAALTRPSSALSPVVSIAHASNVTLSDVRISYIGAPSWRLPPALSVRDSDGVSLQRLRIEGGVSIAGGAGIALGWSDVSNALGAQNGTCVYVPGCGNSSTLTACGLTVHDNLVHDCRWDGASVYEAAAQGVMLGAQDGSSAGQANGGCTVGVIVRNNDVRDIDQMGMRVSNDALCSNVLNELFFNRVSDWGQLSRADGGDSTDCGCLYVYGHWYGPGNNFSFNECIVTNSSWGQNGAYLDDASSGQIIVGNYFRGQSAGVALKLNGGHFNVVDSNIVVDGIGLGFANCRSLRPPESYIYTCENSNTGARWLRALEGMNYLSPPWSEAFPFYKGWCRNTTAGPNDAPCAPPGAPTGYECASLSRGNAISNFAGVAMRRNSTFAIPTAPGFPFLDEASACPTYVVSAAFNSISVVSDPFWAFEDDVFVDAAGGDYTLRPDAPVFASMPSFVRVDYKRIGIGGAARPVPPMVLSCIG